MSNDQKVLDLHMQNPPIWKDWFALAGTLLTIAVVLIQGGRILESQDNMKQQLNQMVGVVAGLKEESSAMRTEVATLKGVDALHAEQLKNLRDQLDMTKPAKRN